MADDQLDVLENRIVTLENLVFGTSDKDSMYPRERTSSTECIDSLNNLNKNLTTAVQGKKRICDIYRKLSDLQKNLDPAYTDELTLSESVKTDIILAEEEFLRQQAQRLESVDNIKDTLDSQHLKCVPENSKKLQELSQIHISQQDKTAGVTEETRNLLAAYNTIIFMLSKQFVQWDEILTEVEAKSQKKTSD